MSKRVFSTAGSTFTAAADGLLGGSSAYMGITNGTAVASCQVIEIYIGGQATASTVSVMLFARSSTLAITPTTILSPFMDGPMNSFAQAVASPVATWSTASTQSTRSGTVT